MEKVNMTREEAIKQLKIELSKWESECKSYHKTKDALKKGIEALEQESCEDIMTIHTQGLDEEIRCTMCTNSMKSDRGCDGGCMIDNDMYKKVMDIIRNRTVSSVKPVREKGHWIESNYEHMNGNIIRRWYCSKCGGMHHDPETGKWRELFDFRYAYCPLCGIEMES